MSKQGAGVARRALLPVALLALMVSAVTASEAVAAPAARPTAVSAVRPSRVLDTRLGIGGTSGRVVPGQVVQVPVDAAAAAGASTVVLNLTATGATEAGWARAFPCDQAQPPTSSINFVPGRDVANAVVVKLGGGKVCLASSAPVYLIVDVGGWSTTDDITSISPARLVDTRQNATRLAANEVRRVDVAGVGGVGANAGLAVLNLTIDRPAGTGWAVLFPCGQSSGGSTINFLGAQTVASTTIVGLGGGDVCVTSSVDTDFILDAYGWSSGAGTVKAQTPTRVLDTRDAATWPFGAAQSDSTITLRVAGVGGVPNSASAALLTVTVDNPGGDGYVSVWPCDQSMPTASILNTWQGVPRANFTLAQLSATDGTVCLRYVANNSKPTNLIVDAVGWVTGSFARSGPGAPIPPTTPGGGVVQPSAGCQLALADKPTNVAFCETFDKAAPVAGTRSGDLDPTLWGVSRTSTHVNMGQNINALWYKASSVPGCTLGVTPDDVKICNGRLVEGVNDGGYDGRTNLSMYPKQPFDIAGRTGTVAFDVSADADSPHAAWPEFWWTDQPVPTPHGDGQGYDAAARNSFGFSIAGCNGDNSRTGVTMMAISQNFVQTALDFQQTGCITKGSVNGALNHIELRINAGGAEVWGTDAGGTTLKKLAAVTVAMPLTRGVVWLEDAHYNACKFDDQCDHAFAWDNLTFDGPAPYRDMTFDVPDAKVPYTDGSLALGYRVEQSPVSMQAQNVHWLQTPTAAYVAFNWAPIDFNVPMVRVNGGPWHQTAWPYGTGPMFWRTYAVPVDLSELRTGTNTIEFQQVAGAEPTVVANVNIILIAASPVP
jgi:hypothetical protein